MYAVALAIIEIVGYSVATQQNTWEARTAICRRSSAFATVGALVASRQPRNAVGWMFLGVAVLVALSVIGGEYANYVLVEEPGLLPGGYFAGWLYLWTWFPDLALIATVPLVFPDGRVPGPRWRPRATRLIRLRGARRRAVDAQARRDERPRRAAVARQPDRHRRARPDLRHSRPSRRSSSSSLLVLAVASSIVRFRRSRGDERQQLKWMTYGVVVWIG